MIGEKYHAEVLAGATYAEVAKANHTSKNAVGLAIRDYRRKYGIKSAAKRGPKVTIPPQSDKVLSIIIELNRIDAPRSFKEIKARTKLQARQLTHILRDLESKGHIISSPCGKSNIYTPTSARKIETYKRGNVTVYPPMYATGFGFDNRQIAGTRL